jgi:hypothetical protein
MVVMVARVVVVLRMLPLALHQALAALEHLVKEITEVHLLQVRLMEAVAVAVLLLLVVMVLMPIGVEQAVLVLHHL